MIAPRDSRTIKIAVCGITSRARHSAYVMDRITFERAVKSVAGFTENDDGPLVQSECEHRVVGLSGLTADPLDHPLFGQLVNILACGIPERKHRGLWTGLDWANHRHKDQVEHLLGPRPNRETANQIGLLAPASRQPAWRDDGEAPQSVEEVLLDDGRMWDTIERCPHQRACGAAVTPRGFFFCEAAAIHATRDEDGPLGLPLDPGCWAHDLADYRYQIERWCPGCELCLEETE